MQIIIDIPEEYYNAIKAIPDRECIVDTLLIKYGKPLPKGHGKLGDLDIILNKAKRHRKDYMEAENSSYCRGKLHAYESYIEEVENAPTIIEADKESE